MKLRTFLLCVIIVALNMMPYQGQTQEAPPDNGLQVTVSAGPAVGEPQAPATTTAEPEVSSEQVQPPAVNVDTPPPPEAIGMPAPAIEVSAENDASGLNTSMMPGVNDNANMGPNTSTAPSQNTTGSVVTGNSREYGRQYRANNEKRFSMYFDKASIDQVLRFFNQISGLTIIKDTDISGDITIISDGTVTLEDAFGVLNSALAIKGYTAIRSEKTLKIVAIDAAKTVNVPVKKAVRPEDIPNSDEYITLVLPLTYLDAYQTRKDLATLVSKRADMSANTRSNTLIITDSAANARRIAEIVKALDTPQVSSTQIRIFTLKNADATTLMSTLNTIFKQDNTSTQSSDMGGGPGAFFRRMQQQNQDSGNTDISATDLVQSRLRTQVRFSVDERTNSLIVSAPSADMETLSLLVDQLDKDATEQEGTLVIHLQHGDASALATIIRNLLSSTSGTSGTSGTTRTNNFNNQVRVTQTAAQAKTSTLAGQVQVQADKDTNSLLFLTSPRNYEVIKKMVQDLDYARPQVLIEVLVAERSLDNDSELGIEWSLFTTTGHWLGQSITSMASTNFSLQSLFNGGLRYSIGNDNVGAMVQAMKKDSKLNILSTPRVLTSDNSAATVKVGRKIPFLTSRQVTDTGSVYNSYNYQDVGITLTVTPKINPDGYVSMNVHPVISKIQEVTYYEAPVIANREAETEVMVRDGATVIIGGLMKDDFTETVTKVPLLGDVPLVGKFFQSSSKTKEKTELMVFLTPHVIRTPEDLNNVSAPDLKKLEEIKEQRKKGK